MSKEERRVPDLRFKGFHDDWEQRKLNDIYEIKMGHSPKSENYTSNPYDYILVQGNADLINGWVSPRVWTTQVTSFVKAGSILISVRAPVGNVGKTTYDVVIGRGIAAVKGDEFVFQLLTKMHLNGYWKKFSTGSTFESINSKDIKEALIVTPTIVERNTIGLFLEKIDDMITLHQQKINILLKLKGNFMLYLFPGKEKLFPELRFSGFHTAWEQRKLGDYGSVAMNRRIFKDETSEIGGVPFYKIGTFGKKPNSYISREKFEEYKSKYPYPEVGDILISASGSIGRTIEYKGEEAYYQDSNIVWLKHNGSIDNHFLKQYYNIIKWNGIEGTTIKRLYNKNILNTRVIFPKITEQRKIGFLLKELDKIITLHQQKINRIVKLKRIYLQKMFL